MKHARPQLARAALACALALWLGGAGCLLCCERGAEAASVAGVTSAATHAAAVADPDACPMHAARRAKPAAKADADKPCDADAGSDACAGESSPASGVGSCCRAKDEPFVASKKQRADFEAAAAPSSGVLAPPARRPPNARAPSSPTRLADSGETYLRCCIFLI